MAQPTHDGFIPGKGALPHTWLIERAVLDHLGEADLEAACKQSIDTADRQELAEARTRIHAITICMHIASQGGSEVPPD